MMMRGRTGRHQSAGSPAATIGTVKRVLITGMSGTGKSTVIEELAARGLKAVDADYGGQDWIWREDRIAELLSTEDADVLFLSGTAPNQEMFYGQFDHIVLLTAPASVMTERLIRRTNNQYGKDPRILPELSP
jgi:adenylate kinase family enzyme